MNSEIDLYCDGKWLSVPESILKFPKGSSKNWEKEFCELNGLNIANNFDLEGRVYSPKDLSEPREYPYVMIFDWLGDGRVVVFKKWTDVMSFLNNYSLIVLDGKLDLIADFLHDIKEDFRSMCKGQWDNGVN